MNFGYMEPNDFNESEYADGLDAYLQCDDCQIEIKEKEEYIICFDCQVAFCYKCSHNYVRADLTRYKCIKDHRMIIIGKIIKDLSNADQNGCHKCKKAIKS